MSTVSNRRSIKAKFFRGLADESRLSILETLAVSEKTVSEIVQLTNLTQPNVSNHLSCLKRCGLVTSRQDGRSVAYSLNVTKVLNVLLIADEILDTCATQVDRCDTLDLRN
ncbi:MAG: metalloregulator ArsR/SmtB family transcription factor [Candidatus Obscuribacterales bacterium]|jgi:ArsR family transcriptional regulator, cadmium/lead-responsive transcriptional repressor|nr:metalloregulator ArsR/SmtB family transcription factor [Candidatus Obscuribacterales bacterium]